MSEAALWNTLRRKLKPYGHCVRVENAIEVGTPDVNLCVQGTESWIELKHREHWPKRANSIVTVRHFTDDQRRWLANRIRSEGRCGVLLQISNTYMYLHGRNALYVGRVERARLYELAVVWEKTIVVEELLVHMRVARAE